MPIRFNTNLSAVERQITSLLTRYASRVESDVDRIVLAETKEVRQDIVDNWPEAEVDGGTSRDGWSDAEQVAPAHYRLTNPVVYAGVIEYGAYPNPGPKTAAEPGQILPGGANINPGVYPTQVPSAPMRRALSKSTVRLRDKLNNVVNKP